MFNLDLTNISMAFLKSTQISYRSQTSKGNTFHCIKCLTVALKELFVAKRRTIREYSFNSLILQISHFVYVTQSLQRT